MNGAIIVILTLVYTLAVVVIHYGDKPQTPGEQEEMRNKHEAANAIAMLVYVVAMFWLLK